MVAAVCPVCIDMAAWLLPSLWASVTNPTRILWADSSGKYDFTTLLMAVVDIPRGEGVSDLFTQHRRLSVGLNAAR